jgi:hypothetical protein
MLVVLMGVTLYPICGAVFRCGCNIVRGATHCNVHRPGVPHCPWCSATGRVVGANFAVILSATAGAAYSGVRWRRRAWAGVIGGVLGYLLSTAVVTLVTALAVGYPVWLGVRL